MHTEQLEFSSVEQQQAVFGTQDSYLRIIEKAFTVSAIMRDSVAEIKGENDAMVSRAAKVVQTMQALYNQGEDINRETVYRLIEEAGKLISSLTNYASVAVTPAMTQISIRQFEIIAVDKMNFVIVVVTDSGTVKNKMVRTMADVSKDEAELLTYVLNQTLTGLPLSHITAERFDIVRRAAGLSALLAPVAEYLAELIEELSDQKVFLEGTNKLLRFPEYRDMRKAQVLLDYMEDDRRHLLPATRKIDGIQFFIGPENGENPLSDTSAIYAKYDIGKIGQGVIGIVGPTRMDYARLSAQLSRFAKGLNRLIAETFLDEKDGKR